MRNKKQIDKLSSWEGGGVEVSLNAWKAAQADAARYQWLRRTATKLSFDNVLIGSLVRDQSELDGAINAYVGKAKALTELAAMLENKPELE